MLSLLWLIFTAIITNEICRACNIFMVATPSVDSLFADCTYMLSINRDAPHWTNRANIIHGIRCSTLLWFLSKIKFKFIFSVSVIDVIVIAASVRQHWHTQESNAFAALMVRSAHGKCHHVLQLSQKMLFSFAESLISSSSKITLLHFGHSKMSLYPSRHGNTNDL